MLKTDSNNVVYYRLYITYTLSDGFLFDLDWSNVWIDVQKIEQPLSIRISLPIPQKIYSITKRLIISEGVEQHFPAGFLVLYIIHRTTQIPSSPVDIKRKKIQYRKEEEEEEACCKDQTMVNNRWFIIHKTAQKKEEGIWLWCL